MKVKHDYAARIDYDLWMDCLRVKELDGGTTSINALVNEGLKLVRDRKMQEIAAKEYPRRRDKGKRDPNYKPEQWSFNIARPSVGREILKRDKREFGERKRLLSSRMGRYLKNAEEHLDNVCRGVFP